ncbi:MAG: inverse autotransporter beta domain-containing protein [Planctomycetaceae bacterium]|nr:inverse autotransporter beta domain-containing protein [Planctomycetaceae bacterium]
MNPRLKRLSILTILTLVACVCAFPARATAQILLDARVGHTAMPAFGRETGITHLELMPYLMEEDEYIFFTDLRGFLNNEGNVGGNVGMGYRFLEPNQVMLLGLHGGYGADQSLEKIYQQMYFGLEGLTRFGSLTSNFYFPIGNDEQVLETTVGNLRPVGNQIVLDSIDAVGVAMRGLDLNIGAYLPGEFADEHQIEAVATWYHYEGSGVDRIDGVKLGLEGQIVPSLNAQIGVSNDQTFGTNVTLGMTFRFGNNDIPDQRLDRQMRRFTDNNYNVIVSKKAVVGTAIPLINPTTGNAFTVRHVQNTPISGAPVDYVVVHDGSAEDPYENLYDVQGSNADIIFVHRGSVIEEQVVLQEGQMLIGEGADYLLNTSNYNLINLNSAFAQVSDRADLPAPIIQPRSFPVPGQQDDPAKIGLVEMASNSVLAGVTIDGSNYASPSAGILASGIHDYRVDEVSIRNTKNEGLLIEQTTGGIFKDLLVENTGTTAGTTNHQQSVNETSGWDGIAILDNDGELQFQDIIVRDAAGSGVVIAGGHGDAVFSNTLELTGNGTANTLYASGLEVRDLELITTVDDQGTETTDDDIETDIFGRVLVESLIVQSPNGIDGVSIRNSTGLVDLFEVDINTTNGAGVFTSQADLVNIRSGSVSSQHEVSVALIPLPINKTGAIVTNASDVNLQLDSISADGSKYGINMVNTTGTILSRGDGEAGSGGVIKNTQAAIHAVNSGSVGMSSPTFENNLQVASLDTVEVFDIVSANITGTTQSFIDAHNVKLFAVTNSLFEENSLSSDIGINYTADDSTAYVAQVVRNTVHESPKTFLNVATQGNVTDATLDFLFANNSVQILENGSIATTMNWTGPLSASFDNNLISGEEGTHQKGFQIWTGTSNDVAVLDVTNNVIGFVGNNGTAVEILGGSSINSVVSNNVVEFRGRDGVGTRISANAASQIAVAGNVIEDLAGGATGILFPSIYDGSSLVLNSNIISLQDSSVFADRGIILSNVTGTNDPFVELISTLNNTITGASTIYSLPTNAVTGRILINGVVVP